MKNNKFSTLLKEWYEGNLSFDERMSSIEENKVEANDLTEQSHVEAVNRKAASRFGWMK